MPAHRLICRPKHGTKVLCVCCAGPFGLTACLARSCCGAVLHQRGVPRRRPSPVHDRALLPSSACSDAPRSASPCTAGHASLLKASLCKPGRASPPALAHAPRFGSPKQGGRRERRVAARRRGGALYRPAPRQGDQRPRRRGGGGTGYRAQRVGTGREKEAPREEARME